MNRHEDASIQTSNLFPYEHLLLGMLDQNGQNISQESSDSRLSPNSMLDRYIEACTRVNSFSSNNSKTSKQIYVQHVTIGISDECNNNFFFFSPGTNDAKQKQKKKGEEDPEENGTDNDNIDKLLQLMQIQLQFERQRREVHAERNRRLLGKLRDSRASEEHNLVLVGS